MSKKRNFLKGLPQSTLRQWRSSPTYIFLIWRWGCWLFALAWLLTWPKDALFLITPTSQICLAVAFVYTLIVTLYAPVSHMLLSQITRRSRKLTAAPSQSPARRWRNIRRDPARFADTQEEARIIRPLLDTRNRYANIIIYCLDVLICGLLTYYGGANGTPSFGDGSPFYRYGLSAILVSGFTYSYTGGLLATLAYSCFAILGAFFPPPGQILPLDTRNLAFNIIGSLVDAPLIALLAAYLANQLNKAIASKHREQEHARRERSFRTVSEMLVTDFTDQVQLLRRSVKAIRQGGRFEKLVIALVRHDTSAEPRPDFDTYVETDVVAAERPDVSAELVSLVAKTGRRHESFDPLVETLDDTKYGIARLYLPFFNEGQVYLVIGAERIRETPFTTLQEEFLATIGPQLIVALENIRLNAESATLAERGRIAREIHDGVAQLLYMLSLNSETCLALLDRSRDTAEQEDDSLAQVRQSLERQVTISKQALWETRHYMFTLQPLISGTTTLTQMLTAQLQEFEAISGLKTHLEVMGEEETLNGRQNQRNIQVGMAIFRITQEALTNAYKHAQASQLEVRLHYLSNSINVEVSDNGRGMHAASQPEENERIYSGRGINGMRARAEELNGTVEIHANPTGGTCITASIPL
jgi:signal transduction histidine kinase